MPPISNNAEHPTGIYLYIPGYGSLHSEPNAPGHDGTASSRFVSLTRTYRQ